MRKKADKKIKRPPIVSIMGHVDHGKTSILDKIRESNLASKEAGAITQHIGAYSVDNITFIDTPGHAAFSQMRARGGHVADIVVLVVSADEGVKEQTREAISHAKAAGALIMVAINKCDLPTADPAKVRQELSTEGVVVESLGGDIVCVEISAETGKGIKELLEMINLLADMKGIAADPGAGLKATVIESHMDNKRGPIVSLIILEGTLGLGQELFSSQGPIGKAKAMFDDRGRSLKEVLPGYPVEVLGVKEVLLAGSIVFSETQESGLRRGENPPEAASYSEDSSVLNVVVKSDTQGTLEAVTAGLMKLGNEESHIKIIHQAVGAVTESDVLLASSAQSMIVGFNVLTLPGAADLSLSMKVTCRTYSLIYELFEDVEKRLAGLQIEEEFKGKGLAVVVDLFPLTSGDVVVGLFITHGRVQVNDKVRLLREGEEMYKGHIKQLRVHQERVKKVNKGQECGALLQPQFAFQISDVVEVV